MSRLAILSLWENVVPSARLSGSMSSKSQKLLVPRSNSRNFKNGVWKICRTNKTFVKTPCVCNLESIAWGYNGTCKVSKLWKWVR